MSLSTYLLYNTLWEFCGQRVVGGSVGLSPRKPTMSPYWAAVTDFGYMLLAAELLLGYAGYWADKRFHTAPWLLIVGILLGLAVSFKHLFSALDRAAKAEKAARKGSGEGNSQRPR